MALATACAASTEETAALLDVWRQANHGNARAARPVPVQRSDAEAVGSAPPADPAHLVTLEEMVRVAASLDEANGGLHAARRLYERVRVARSALLGADAPATLAAAHNLGTVLAQLGEARSAGVVLSETYEARRRTLGEVEPATLATLENLATANADLGEFVAAIELLERALAARRPETSPGHAGYAYTAERLLDVLERAGDRNRMREVVKELESVRRDDDPGTAGDRHRR
nr:tetratricopeptide repeat protein [Micromonospora radicis]